MTKNLWLLTLSQIFSFTAAPVTVFLSGIIGSQISPLKSLSTLPMSISVVGIAIGAIFATKVMSLIGRKAGFIAASIGMPLGAFAAYKKGIWDQILLRSSESFQSFPVLILAMGTIAAIGSGMFNIIFVIAIVNIPVYIRLTRSSVIPILEKDFIYAAKCAGKSDLQILFKHILPNVSPVVISQFSVNCAWAIQILAALSFVGLGVKLPTPEWGAMVKGGSDYILYGQWWVSVFPGIAILLTVLTLNQVADVVGEKHKF